MLEVIELDFVRLEIDLMATEVVLHELQTQATFEETATEI